MGTIRRPWRTYVLVNGIRVGMVKSITPQETATTEKQFGLGDDRPAEVTSTYSGGTLSIDRMVIWHKSFIQAAGFAFKSIRDLNSQDVSIQEQILNPDGTVDVNTYHDCKCNRRTYTVTAGAGGTVVETIAFDFSYVD